MGDPAPVERDRSARGICAYGDAVVDVVVELAGELRDDGDVPAVITVTGGGQAANVAAWTAALGRPASIVTRLGDDPGGRLTRAMLEDLGVVVCSPSPRLTTGTVVSLVRTDGTRTMASDRRPHAELVADDLRREWFVDRGWLHVSGYTLFGPRATDGAIVASAMARAAGMRVSIDVSSVSLVEALATGEAQRRITATGACTVFANQAEARALRQIEVETLVVKRGAAGASVRDCGTETLLEAHPVAEVVDTTGAGDAFAAGWLLGGHRLAAAAAAACVATVGAMPPPGWRPERSVSRRPSR